MCGLACCGVEALQQVEWHHRHCADLLIGAARVVGKLPSCSGGPCDAKGSGTNVWWCLHLWAEQQHRLELPSIEEESAIEPPVEEPAEPAIEAVEGLQKGLPNRRVLNAVEGLQEGLPNKRVLNDRDCPEDDQECPDDGRPELVDFSDSEPEENYEEHESESEDE